LVGQADPLFLLTSGGNATVTISFHVYMGIYHHKAWQAQFP
jgi:hypothetical protein